MATTVYKPVHGTIKKTANYDKVTATSRGSYLMHADEQHAKVFINKIEKTKSIYTKI